MLLNSEIEMITKLKSMVSENLPRKRIAIELNVERTYLYRLIAKHCPEVYEQRKRRIRTAPQKPWMPYERRRLIKLTKQSYTIPQIAKILERPYTSVYAYLYRNDIPYRLQRPSKKLHAKLYNS